MREQMGSDLAVMVFFAVMAGWWVARRLGWLAL